MDELIRKVLIEHINRIHEEDIEPSERVVKNICDAKDIL